MVRRSRTIISLNLNLPPYSSIISPRAIGGVRPLYLQATHVRVIWRNATKGFKNIHIKTSEGIHFIHQRLRRTERLIYMLTQIHLCLFIMGWLSLGCRRRKGSTDHLRKGRGPHGSHHSPAPYRWWALQFFLTADTWAYSLCSIIPPFWRSTYRFLIPCCISATWRHSNTVSNPSAHHRIRNSNPDTELCSSRNIAVRTATADSRSNPIPRPTQPPAHRVWGLARC
jgi:hypothetical protein